MKPDVVIVRLGELTLKGRNRYRFENKIKDQIALMLKPFPKTKLHEEYGRVYIVLNDEPYDRIAEGLDRIFGLFSYSPAVAVAPDLEEIREKGLALIRSLTPYPATFKVSAKRADKSFPHNSQELGYLVGGYILSHEDGKLKVDVHKPDAELRVDIRQNEAYLFTQSITGTGGYPLGSNGKAVLMLSGGIDSPVAGWLSMRKGLEIEAVHFHSYPYTSEKARQKVEDLTRQLAMFADRIVLHLVPFTEIQTGLKQEAKEQLMITLMRRSMFRITEKLAGIRGAGAIVTGESLGQVASQTLSSLSVIGHGITVPMLRPLIAMDKMEITAISKKIGTYPISILPYEDCCTLFVPKSPSTNPNLSFVERSERGMGWLAEKEAEAVAGTERLVIERDAGDEFDEYF
ncbi:tRNA uracil 4-sulfurtransferase ThiI [Gorillibacterium massiliense]|uniref:tRNA uracil 4-sulfurtransferase ThiI n=1 Tax=Gorillibacterium massiliense TaxID=1280390 RepID=UPI0004BAA51F|nr:tRNA uracil 4-sulfurtransferase ThiI [Gorillibacterium massiliense]